MREENFINFCMAMQCAKVASADVKIILQELEILADAEGYDKKLIEELKNKLKD
jgi:hypothetical protein